MKILALALFLTAAVVLTGAGDSAVTYVDHEKVAAAMAKGGPLFTAADVAVTGSLHSGPTELAEVHEKTTHVFYVIDGSATMLVGGTLGGGKVTRPNEIRGPDIQGGKSQRLSKGDVIVIPAGTPHWWKEVPQSINIYSVNVLKP